MCGGVGRVDPFSARDDQLFGFWAFACNCIGALFMITTYPDGDLILGEISLKGILHCPNCGFCKIGQFPAPLDAEGQRGEDEDKVAEVAFLFRLAFAFGPGKDQAVLTGPVF